jgi:hypothetical protein
MTFISFLGAQVNYDLEILRDIGVALIILAVAVLVRAWLKCYEPDPERLTGSLPTLPLIGIQIICGDCSGEASSPRITYMDSTGHCARCGSGSVMLACKRGIYLQSLLAARMSNKESARTEAHILPFARASGTNAKQARKMAG